MIKKFFLVLILALVIIAGVFAVYYYQQKNTVNHLVAGVPYHGFYNDFLQFRHVSAYSSVFDILDFWGDERFSFSGVKETLGQSELGLESLSIATFFKDNGYETYYEPLSLKQNEAISQIKKFVNGKTNIPVIIYQGLSDDPERISTGMRVVIGVFDDAKKLIVHDHNFGNNYEISYDVFEKMLALSVLKTSKILAVWPSDDLKTKISGPDFSRQYPQRPAVMDKAGELLVKYADAEYLRLIRKDPQRSIELYKELLNDPEINEFPPAMTIGFYTGLAFSYLSVNQPDNAIALINEKVLPTNINQPYGGWTGYAPGQTKLATPYYILGRAYLMKADDVLAKNNFEETLKIRPDFDLAIQAIEKLNEKPKE